MIIKMRIHFTLEVWLLLLCSAASAVRIWPRLSRSARVAPGPEPPAKRHHVPIDLLLYEILPKFKVMGPVAARNLSDLAAFCRVSSEVNEQCGMLSYRKYILPRIATQDRLYAYCSKTSEVGFCKSMYAFQGKCGGSLDWPSLKFSTENILLQKACKAHLRLNSRFLTKITLSGKLKDGTNAARWKQLGWLSRSNRQQRQA